MIKLFVTDCDGTMTDGKMYYSQNGLFFKSFNTKDAIGFNILKEKKIDIIILTGHLHISEKRAKDLQIPIYESFNKLEFLQEYIKGKNISKEEIAYIGDDINDIECLKYVEYAACPNDSSYEVQNIPGINIISKKGGEGCVRFFIHLLNQRGVI